MSDTESDSDLNVDRYDSEDNLNVYGSPIHESSPHELVGAEQAEWRYKSKYKKVGGLPMLSA